jgi:hypothetical protein
VNIELQATTDLQVIGTEDGPVTQVSLQRLEEIAGQKQQGTHGIADHIAKLQAEVASLQAQAGAILTAQTAQSLPPDVVARIEAARGLERLISNLEQSISGVEGQPHHGLGGFVQGFKDRHEIQSLQSQLQSAKAELPNRYRAVVDNLKPPTGVSDADSVLQHIQANLEQLTELAAQSEALTSELARFSIEIKRRSAAVAALGFDAPAVEAD